MLFQVGLHLLDHVRVMRPVLFVTFVLFIIGLSNFDESNISVSIAQLNFCTPWSRSRHAPGIYKTYTQRILYIQDIHITQTIYIINIHNIYYTEDFSEYVPCWARRWPDLPKPAPGSPPASPSPVCVCVCVCDCVCVRVSGSPPTSTSTTKNDYICWYF